MILYLSRAPSEPICFKESKFEDPLLENLNEFTKNHDSMFAY